MIDIWSQSKAAIKICDGTKISYHELQSELELRTGLAFIAGHKIGRRNAIRIEHSKDLR